MNFNLWKIGVIFLSALLLVGLSLFVGGKLNTNVREVEPKESYPLVSQNDKETLKPTSFSEKPSASVVKVTPTQTPQLTVSTETPVENLNLTRPKAAELIVKNPKFPEIKKQQFSPVIAFAKNKAGSEFQFLVQAMELQGYIDSNGDFTEKGNVAKANWKQLARTPDWYEILLGDRKLAAVTGISDSQNPLLGAYTQVTFTWYYSPVNDIGKSMNLEQKIYKGEALFQKFDDGWRIQNITFSYK